MTDIADVEQHDVGRVQHLESVQSGADQRIVFHQGQALLLEFEPVEPGAQIDEFCHWAIFCRKPQHPEA